MDRFVLFIFSFFAVVSIGMLIFFIGPETEGLGTYSSGGKVGYATEVLTKQRIMAVNGGDGVPRETGLRKGALDSFGGGACPEGYRLANKYECRFIPCVPVAADYASVNLGKQCKPIVVSPPVYPEQGILK